MTGGARWDGRRLIIDLDRSAELPAIHLDLAWNASAGFWKGLFAYAGDLYPAITLKRPQGRTTNSLVGTWFDGGSVFSTCLHIAQATDGTLTAWSYALQIPGRIRYANGLRPPESTAGRYGDFARLLEPEPGRLQVELGANTAICCSHPFSATISPDGMSLVGDWPAAPNQAHRPVRWTRVGGDSCLAEASRLIRRKPNHALPLE